jgi:hypothetical protein
MSTNNAARDDDFDPTRRAGLLPDELLPGQNGDELAGSAADLRGDAAGSPDGGLSSTGLGGTTRGDGSPNEDDLTDALGGEEDDDLSDTVEGTHPEAGSSGGAIGGTPVGKRARAHKASG